MGDKLKGQTIIITGGGRSFGENMSKGVAAEKANVAVVDRDLEEAERVANTIISEGGSALAVKADVSDEKQVRDIISKTLDQFGQIDVLVNNAGISGPSGKFDDSSYEDWKSVYQVNVNGVFLCIREVLPHMREQNSGHIVNISSTTARYGFSHIRSIPYISTKWSVEGITWCLSVTEKEHNIRVNALCPGLAYTYFQRNSPRDYFVGQKCWNPDHTVGPLLYILTEMNETGQSIESPDWHEERGTSEKFSYVFE
jgi:NAD(P)-dependent dehydrogenase (short-subunit alcohol dehydrogenase family)